MTTAPPGWRPDTGTDPQALIEEARRRQRRRYLVTGLVTVALLAGVGVAASQLAPGRTAPVHLGSGFPIAAAPVSYATAPAYYAYLDQGSLYSYTSRGTQYGESVPGRYLKVRATATGKLLATVSPPRPYNDFWLLSADADGRTFVLGTRRYWEHNAGPSPRLARRDQRTPLTFQIVQITPGGHVRLSPLFLPEALTVKQSPSIALSPDGTRLAVAFYTSRSTAMLQVITLSTGRVRQWTAPHTSWTPLLNGAGAWTADGRTLAFQQQAMAPVRIPGTRPIPRTASLRLLDTAAPGASLTGGKLLVMRAPAGESAPGAPVLTPDGRTVICLVGSLRGPRLDGRRAGELAVYSAGSGALLRATARWSWPGDWPSRPGRGGFPRPTVAWSNGPGSQLIVLLPRDSLNVLGVASGDTFTQAGGALLPQQPGGYQELQYALRTSSQVAW
jgi:hypothetical protein